MSKIFVAWPSIDQFRHAVRDVAHYYQHTGEYVDGKPVMDRNAKMPQLTFTGTTKIHGTNAAIGISANGDVWAQSRTQIITPENDNFGFAKFVEARKDFILSSFSPYLATYSHAIFYGEWCGPNIQRGVAVDKIPERIFVVFGAMFISVGEDGNLTTVTLSMRNIKSFLEHTVEHWNQKQIYNIFQFKHWEVSIDFEHPENIQNHLVELTTQVEESCPVGEYFGVSGVGEGIVWTCNIGDHTLRFKVKGEKHSVTKVKKLASVDVEKVASINEFVERTVTENRLRQGLESLVRDGIELGAAGTGDFIKWISQDILKEEADVLAESGLTMKNVGGAIAKKARTWYNLNGF